MRRLVKTSAICLRALAWRDSSRIVNLLTRDFGLIPALARGARRPKSVLGAATLLFARSEVTLYLPKGIGLPAGSFPSGAELATLSDAEPVNNYPGIISRYHRFLVASSLARLLLRTVIASSPEPRLFLLLENTLTVLDAAPEACTDFSALFGSFILKTCAFLGFRPHLDRCARCHRPLNAPDAIFSISAGGLLCESCASLDPGIRRNPPPTRLNPAEIQTLKTLLYSPTAETLKLEISPELTEILKNFAEYHLEPRHPHRR